MKLPRPYGSTRLTILSLPKDGRGIFSPRVVGNKIPRAAGIAFGDAWPKRKTLRFAYSAVAAASAAKAGDPRLNRGVSRRGIKILLDPIWYNISDPAKGYRG